jgi:glutathione S-transferase
MLFRKERDMKLYYAPGACSLADHLALIEAGVQVDLERVDLHAKTTASGDDFRAINPKGYVPALVLDSGETITENVAVLDWIASQYPSLGVSGPLGRARQLEALAFIATELHPSFKPMWHGGSNAEQTEAKAKLADRLALLDATLQGDYLFGDELSVADCYLFVMLRWAERFGIAVPGDLIRLRLRMENRPAVQAAIRREESVSPHTGSAAAVTENPQQKRFERPINDNEAAVAYYRLADGKVELFHTVTPTEFSGRGIATELAHGTFGLLRESGRKAVLKCPFMVHFYTTHPEYADVVAG